MANSTTGDGSYSPNLTAGVGGTGTVYIDTGPLSVDFVSSGLYYNGNSGDGTITVTGVGADIAVADAGLYAYSRITVGQAFDSYSATGRLDVYDGATITSTNNASVASGSIPLGGYSNLQIGLGGPNSDGSVLVSGVASGGQRSSLVLNGGSAGFVIGGDGGTGTLTIEAGANFRTLTGVIGQGSNTGSPDPGGTGTVTVTGAGSEFKASTLSGNFLVNADQAPVIFVGQNDGTGEIDVDSGALFLVQNEIGDGKSSPTLVFGDDVGSTGTGRINGAGSELRITQHGAATSGNRLNGDSGLIVGGAGSGDLDVLSLSQVNILGDRANLIVSLGSYDAQGAPVSATGTMSIASGSTVTVDSQGYGNDGGATVTVGARRLSDGYLQIQSNGTLAVQSSTDLVGDDTTGLITIGGLGNGELHVANAGALTGTELVIGARGYVANALNNSTDQIFDGYNAAPDGGGTGVVTVDSGGGSNIVITGTANNPDRGITVGQASGTTGTLNIADASSYVKSEGGRGRVIIGKYGAGEANVTNAGALYGAQITVGYGIGGPGTVNVSSGGDIVVDSQGSSDFSMNSSGDLQFDGSVMSIGVRAGAVGDVTIDGSGSTITIQNSGGSGTVLDSLASVGVDGMGSLTIQNNGHFINSGTTSSTAIAGTLNGGYTDGTGTVNVLGSGSMLDAGTYLLISGSMDTTTGAVSADAGGFGSLSLVGGSISADSTQIGKRGEAFVDGTIAGNLSNFGDLTIGGLALGDIGALQHSGGNLDFGTGSLFIDVLDFAAGQSDLITTTDDLDTGDIARFLISLELNIDAGATFSAGDEQVLLTTTGTLAPTNTVVTALDGTQFGLEDRIGGNLVLVALAPSDGTGGPDRLKGTPASDTLAGLDGDDVILGLGDDDFLSGGADDDWLVGGAGNDTLDGGAGLDEIDGDSGNDMIFGGAGSDTIDGGAGADSIDGGAGVDTASYANSSAGVIVNLATGAGSVGDAAGDTLLNFENLIGSDHADNLTGDVGNNTIDGGDGIDFISLQDGGNDAAYGGEGDDGIFFGAEFDSGDTVDGGAGDGDQLGLQGDYSAGVTFGAGGVDGIELVVLLAGNNTLFGAPGTEFYDYDFTLVDANIGAGQELAFQANQLRVGEDFTLDASAETDGTVFTFAGLGAETITGGDNDDSFFFGTDRFGPNDRLDGHVGIFDSVGLQGDFSAGITIGPNQLVNIDVLALLSSTDARFGAGSGSLFSYDVTMDDGNVAAGQSMIISSNILTVGENMTFDASAETDGFYLIFSGNGADSIAGSQGRDTISGGGGIDTLTGNGGDDVFLYANITDSVPGAVDLISDFTSGDLIDLSFIDVDTGANGNEAFSFIGSAAFSSMAGQLRAVNTGGNTWTVQADDDGDGAADLEIQVTTSDGDPLTAGDFVL